MIFIPPWLHAGLDRRALCCVCSCVYFLFGGLPHLNYMLLVLCSCHGGNGRELSKPSIQLVSHWRFGLLLARLQFKKGGLFTALMAHPGSGREKVLLGLYFFFRIIRLVYSARAVGGPGGYRHL